MTTQVGCLAQAGLVAYGRHSIKVNYYYCPFTLHLFLAKRAGQPPLWPLCLHSCPSNPSSPTWPDSGPCLKLVNGTYSFSSQRVGLGPLETLVKMQGYLYFSGCPRGSISLRSNLCPKTFLKTIENSAVHEWSLTAGCGQGKSQSRKTLPKLLLSWGDCGHTQGGTRCRPTTEALYSSCVKGEMDFTKIIQPVTKQAGNNNRPWRRCTSTNLLQYII